MNDHYPATWQPVIIVGAGPAGCTAALLLAGYGIPVTLLERHTQPHPLSRAVHLDDEVTRTLDRIGVSQGFLDRSRPGSGLRLLDAGHRVMAEFRREYQASEHGFPQANMFHQPDLEELMLARVKAHPLIDFRRGAEVTGLDGAQGPLTTEPVRVHARIAGQEQTFTGSVVLGCDGANSTIRELAGITMDDLGFTERWLVVDIQVEDGLNTWDGVEQICDPARAATFMQVTGDRYRWEFRLFDGEDEAGLITPAALGALLRPWTGRTDLAGLTVIRSATYTFRARLASRFQAGRVFLLGDAAHLTPPFIGQGLAAGLRDADNLAWKLAHVLTGRAGAGLLASYETERRPHAKALINKAVRVGWAMTGGQDRAAAIRRIALAAAVRSDRVSEFMGSTATPRLKAGALQPAPRRFPPSGIPAALRPGSLIPNPLVSAANGKRARLDTILAGRAAVLTARPPDASLEKFCRRHGLALVQITSTPRTGPPAPPDAGQHADWIDLRLAGDAPPAGIPGLGRRSGADRHREPRPRNRRGGVPVPAAPPALVRSGQCRGRVSGTGSLARPLRARRPGADRPLGGRRFPTHLAGCLLPAVGKLTGQPKTRQSAAHFGSSGPLPVHRGHRGARHLAAAGLGQPLPGLPAAQSRRPGIATAAVTPRRRDSAPPGYGSGGPRCRTRTVPDMPAHLACTAFKCRDQSDLRVHGIAHAARARVLARQLQHQLTEFLADPRAARPTWVSPVASNQTAVPGQQRSRRNPPTAPQCRRQQAGRGCQDRPVGPVRPDPGHLAAQHHHLMPRPGRTSQPNARTMIKYSRRTDTNRDLASTRPPSQIAAHNAYTEF